MKEIMDHWLVKMKEHGSECIHKWRRSFYERPPNGENLDEVCNRVSKFYTLKILPALKKGNVLVSAHGNSLRALFVILNLFNKDEIERVEIPTGKPYIVEFINGNIINNRYISPFKIIGRQILDSRGNPTIEVDVLNNNKLVGRESCPSGASTGSNEAIELRDNGDAYMGKGVNHAIMNVKKFDSSLYLNQDIISNQIIFDKELCRFDGTSLKKNIGGNTTTAISFAVASAAANINNTHLFNYFQDIFNNKNKLKLPTPMVNILNGGKHAGGSHAELY